MTVKKKNTPTKKKKEEPLPPIEIEGLDELPLPDRIDKLGQAILANAFVLMDRMAKGGSKPSKAELERQEEMQKQFKYIQATYNSLIKMNRINDKPNNDNFESGLLDRINKIKSSVGKIVTPVPR